MGRYSFMRRRLKYAENPSTPKAFLVSAHAAIFTAVVTHPFWTLKTRLILHLRASKQVDRNVSKSDIAPNRGS